jgi:hypothetical protein
VRSQWYDQPFVGLGPLARQVAKLRSKKQPINRPTKTKFVADAPVSTKLDFGAIQI